MELVEENVIYAIVSVSGDIHYQWKFLHLKLWLYPTKNKAAKKSWPAKIWNNQYNLLLDH